MHPSDNQEKRSTWPSYFDAISNLTNTDIRRYDDGIEVALSNISLHGRQVSVVRRLSLSLDSDIELIKEKMISNMERTFDELSASVLNEQVGCSSSPSFSSISPPCLSSSSDASSSTCSSSSSSSVISQKRRNFKRGWSGLVSRVASFGRSKEKESSKAVQIQPEGHIVSFPADYPGLNSIYAMQQAWRDFDIRAEKYISSFPNLNLRKMFRLASVCEPQQFDLNNNGLYFNSNEMSFKGAGRPVKRGDEEIEILLVDGISGSAIPEGRELYYSPKDNHVYLKREDAIYHDAVLVSGGNKEPVIMTLCDGCGKGESTAVVAMTAASAALNYMTDRIKSCSTTQEAMRELFQSIKYAQNSIGPLETCRDTTIIQAAIVGNILMGISIGDCSAYVFRQEPKKEGELQTWNCLNLTPGSRNSTYLENPGGFLKSSDDFPPDTVDMMAFMFELQEGDVTFLCSDGTSDSFDPCVQLKKPSELGIQSVDDTWKTVEAVDLQIVEQNVAKVEAYKISQMARVVAGASNGLEIWERLMRQVLECSQEKLMTLILNPNDPKLETLPGKLDDAAIAFYEYRTTE